MGKARKVEDAAGHTAVLNAAAAGVVTLGDVEMFPAREVVVAASLRARLTPTAIRKPSRRSAAR